LQDLPAFVCGCEVSVAGEVRTGRKRCGGW